MRFFATNIYGRIVPLLNNNANINIIYREISGNFINCTNSICTKPIIKLDLTYKCSI